MQADTVKWNRTTFCKKEAEYAHKQKSHARLKEGKILKGKHTNTFSFYN